MINNCPNCGFELSEQLNDGLLQCEHCSQVFTSSLYNQLLAAAWQIRKENLSLDKVKFYTKLDEDLASFVYYFVAEQDYNHQDFMEFLKKLGINKKTLPDI